jgi:biopolymer transport protein ExbD
MTRVKVPVVKEDVTANLIPMIDIMFLLLLFFMLSADMSQRELEELVLPKADMVQEESKDKAVEEVRTTINVHHRPDSASFSCAVNKNGGICREPDHWLIAIRSKDYTLDTLKAQLQNISESALEPEIDPEAKKQLSRMTVIIRADKAAPYGDVQKVIELSGQAGIYKIQVGAAKPEGG